MAAPHGSGMLPGSYSGVLDPGLSIHAVRQALAYAGDRPLSPNFSSTARQLSPQAPSHPPTGSTSPASRNTRSIPPAPKNFSTPLATRASRTASRSSHGENVNRRARPPHRLLRWVSVNNVRDSNSPSLRAASRPMAQIAVTTAIHKSIRSPSRFALNPTAKVAKPPALKSREFSPLTDPTSCLAR
jgi:hypothetical protein